MRSGDGSYEADDRVNNEGDIDQSIDVLIVRVIFVRGQDGN
jgi:hypothetical protein